MLAAAISDFLEEHDHWALLLLFGLVMFESFGLPLPGETALVACGILASQGDVSIATVIVVAALAAILGDNLGYWTARKGGRRLLGRYRFTRSYAERYLPRGERFFAAHGGKTVFFGRFVAVLRVTAAWIAGLSHMDWWRFLAWNAAGGIVWAAGVGLVAYFLGEEVAHAIARYGLYGAVAVIGVAAIVYVTVHRVKKRVLPDDDATPE